MCVCVCVRGGGDYCNKLIKASKNLLLSSIFISITGKQERKISRFTRQGENEF